MKKILKITSISMIVAILMLIGYAFFEHYFVNPPGNVEYYNDTSMAFENDSGENIFVKTYFKEELLEQIKYQNKNSRYPKMFLPYLLKKKKFYLPSTKNEKNYFLDKYSNKENFFTILIPDDKVLFFGENGLPDSCMLELYSHFEFSVIKKGKEVRSTSIDFRRWCEMKNGCLRSTEFKCALKASEIFKD